MTTHLTNHGYFDHRQHSNFPNLSSHAKNKIVPGFVIFNLYLWFKPTALITNDISLLSTVITSIHIYYLLKYKYNTVISTQNWKLVNLAPLSAVLTCIKEKSNQSYVCSTTVVCQNQKL